MPSLEMILYNTSLEMNPEESVMVLLEETCPCAPFQSEWKKVNGVSNPTLSRGLKSIPNKLYSNNSSARFIDLSLQILFPKNGRVDH